MNDTKDSSENAADLWAAEYEQGGIPSSARTSPSGAVLWAVERLRRDNYPLRRAADIGCGKGRNSLYLAHEGLEVTAMDFTANAVRHLQDAIAAEAMGDKIRAIVHDVTEPWPIGEHTLDLAVDTFCFKHVAPHEARLSYKQNLLHALATRGHYLISFASIGDGYYGQYRLSDHDDECVVVDPANGIESVIYSRKRVIQFFAPELDLFAEIKHNKASVMHGTEYPRETYALLFRRNPHIL